ncbi:MAG: acylneuraminate cytidylyltransferase family protein [Lachnospiraceae bacterium]|nr:acylneuraminate cytidylyltransferase family protein [Lachnospiraceae bacterium]
MGHIAVIPARSGSKGLKNKNIKECNGKPLLAYSIEAAQRAGIYDCIHVSTDSEQYAEIAKEYGAEVPFLRDSEMASDAATTWDTMRFVIKEYEKIGKRFDMLTVLQPTSPLRGWEDIRKAYDIFVQRQADSVVGVCEMEHSPLWSNTLPESGCLNGFIRPEVNGPRQGLPAYYRINGAIYIVRVEYLMEYGNLYGEQGYAYIMSREHSVDIDDEIDFALAEFLMKRCEKNDSI